MAKVRRWVVPAFVFAALAASVLPAQAQPTPNEAARAVEVTSLLAEFSQASGKRFFIDPRVRARVSVVPGVEPRDFETLQSILRLHKLVTIETPDGTYVIPEAEARSMPVRVVGADDPDVSAADVVTRVVALDIENAASLVPLLRPLIPQWGHLAATQNKLLIVDHYDNVERIVRTARALADSESRSPQSGARALSTQDYIEIEQLAARYIHAVENCSNGGYDYAELYTEDGRFGVAEQWGAAPEDWRFRAVGRDELAVAAGGGPDGCRDPETLLGYGIRHVVTAHVISPTANGASGRSTLLAIGVGGDPTAIEYQGGYEDAYVRTDEGWRFETRVHVFPNIDESVQFGSGGED